MKSTKTTICGFNAVNEYFNRDDSSLLGKLLIYHMIGDGSITLDELTICYYEKQRQDGSVVRQYEIPTISKVLGYSESHRRLYTRPTEYQEYEKCPFFPELILTRPQLLCTEKVMNYEKNLFDQLEYPDLKESPVHVETLSQVKGLLASIGCFSCNANKTEYRYPFCLSRNGELLMLSSLLKEKFHPFVQNDYLGYLHEDLENNSFEFPYYYAWYLSEKNYDKISIELCRRVFYECSPEVTPLSGITNLDERQNCLRRILAPLEYGFIGYMLHTVYPNGLKYDINAFSMYIFQDDCDNSCEFKENNIPEKYLALYGEIDYIYNELYTENVIDCVDDEDEDDCTDRDYIKERCAELTLSQIDIKNDFQKLKDTCDRFTKKKYVSQASFNNYQDDIKHDILMLTEIIDNKCVMQEDLSKDREKYATKEDIERLESMIERIREYIVAQQDAAWARKIYNSHQTNHDDH